MELEYAGLIVEMDEPEFTTAAAAKAAAEREGIDLALAEACMPAVAACRRLYSQMKAEKIEVELDFDPERDGKIAIRRLTFVGEKRAGTGLTAKLSLDVSRDESQMLPPEPEQRTRLMGSRIGLGESPEAVQGMWTDLITDLAHSDQPVDVNALVQSVLRETYAAQNRDLQFQAEKVKQFNEQKKRIRDALDKMRGHQRAFTTQLDAHLKDIEERLSSVGEDAQLASIDLQNAIQRQQQLLQSMANISKMLHDTAMGVIRKIGA